MRCQWILSLTVLTSLFRADSASAWWWDAPDHGFNIEATTRRGSHPAAGEAVSIDGQVVYRHAHSRGPQTLPHGQRNKIEVRAYFPDYTQEVTDALRLDPRTLKFSFDTPALTEDSPNRFILTVGRKSRGPSHLEVLLAKIEFQILAVERWLERDRRISPRSRAEAEELLAHLKSAADKIRSEMNSDQDLLAIRELPLAVENRTAGVSRHTSLIGGFLFEIIGKPGAPFEGEKIQTTARIVNLQNHFSGVRFSEECRASDRFEIRHSWNGQEIHRARDLPLCPAGESRYEYTTTGLQSATANGYELELTKITRVGRHTLEKKLGELNLPIETGRDTTSPRWTHLAPTTEFMKELPASIDARIEDAFGRIDPQAISLSLTGTTLGGGIVNEDLSPSIVKTLRAEGAIYDLTAPSLFLNEGVYTLAFRGSDLAGNAAIPEPWSTSFRIDRTAPAIVLGVQDGLLTNRPVLELPVTVTDASPTTTRILLNGALVQETSDPAFSVALTLAEGVNTIEVQSTDTAGNASAPALRENIVLDTIVPVLSNFSPTSNAIVRFLTFPVSFQSNERLSRATLEGVEFALDADGRKATGTLTVPSEGTFHLRGTAVDLAGNAQDIDHTVRVVLKLIQESLIAVVPHPEDPEKVQVIGAPGAIFPGSELKLRSGFFNTVTGSPTEDGSFVFEIGYFDQATLTAKNMELGREESATLHYQVDTRLSGVVKDTDNRPLPQAKVYFEGNDSSAVYTNGAGVFVISSPPTGDQTLVVDGATVQEPCADCAPRKFTSATLQLTIGVSQTNALPRPIYLAPHLKDGTEVVVDPASSTVVTSLHAPGVELRIPSGAIQSIPGTQIAISMTETPADRATIAVPEYAKPEKVISLEPSGLRFTKPVDVTLPNENELPPGTNVVLISYDSSTGLWAPDGIAVVSENGSEIVTKPGMGITHFSQIYASPAGPKVRQLAVQDRPGANTFDGALTTAIEMPSYRVLGQNIAPSLVYRSNWANPSVLVTNLFDIPRYDMSFTQTAGGRTLGLRTVQGAINVQQWLEPEKVESQFSTTGLLSETMTFTGVPNQAAISYSFGLGHLSSGVYPYLSHWDITLKHFRLVTRSVSKRKFGLFGPMKTQTETFDESYSILFPQDFGGPLYVQNEAQSPAGRGWKIAGAQRIVNPSENRLMVEEADGSIAGYAVQNTIETVANLKSVDGWRLADGARIQWPYVQTSKASGFNRQVTRRSLADASSMTVGTVLPLTGTIRANWTHNCGEARSVVIPMTIPNPIADVIDVPNGESFALSRNNSLLFSLSGATGNYTRASGAVTRPITFWGGCDHPGGMVATAINWCVGTLGGSCYDAGVILGWPNSSGDIPVHGATVSTVADTQMNRPRSMAAHPFRPVIAIADAGNHRVLELNFQTNQVAIVAGNGQTVSKTDGVSATQSSLVSPVSVAYDRAGQLYVLTEQGYLRRVDLQGTIETLAGLPYNDPQALFADTAPIARVALRTPQAFALDEDRSLIYIADTGHHRVVQLDFTEEFPKARNVAGNGNAGSLGDQGPALNAELNRPGALGLDPQGNLYIVDVGNEKVRRVTFANQNGALLAFAPASQDLSTLTKNPADGTFTRKYRNGTVVSFNAQGRQISAQDTTGRLVQYEYDGDGNLHRQIDPIGGAIEYGYSAGRLTTVTDPTSRITRFFYDSDRLKGVRYPDGTEREFFYDEKGLLTGEKNARGLLTQYVYNEWGRLAEVVRPDTSVLTVNDSGSATAGNSYVGGSVGQMKPLSSLNDSVKEGSRLEMKFKKDESGYIARITDPDGRVTRIDRNLRGQPTVIYRDYLENDPDREDDNSFKSKVTFTYHAATGDLLSQHDTETGLISSQTYNARGDLLTQTSPKNVVTTYVYDTTTGLRTSATESFRGFLGSVQYAHPLKLKTQETNALSGVVNYTYDGLGNLATVTNAIDGSTASTTAYTRDDAGNALTITNAKNQTTRYEYDLWNRLTAVTTAKNERTEYTYSPTGKLTQVKDPLGNTIHFEYDVMDRVVRKTDQLSRITLYDYDSSGNLVYEKDPNGNTKTFVYDNKNQLTKKILPDQTMELAYNPEGQPLSLRGRDVELTFVYDSTDKRVEEAQTRGLGSASDLPNVVLNYEYDAYGNRTEMRDPTGTTLYGYDVIHRLTQVTNPKGEIFGSKFDAIGRLTENTRPGGKTTYTYDLSSFLTGLFHRDAGGSVVAQFVYGRDLIGNRTEIRRPASVLNLGYDDNQQLTSVASSSAEFPNESFTYDEIANRLADQGGSYTYDAKSQRLAEDYRFIYLYDENGNLISRQDKGLSGEVTQFIYSSENQLVALKLFEAGSTTPTLEATYTYDPLGRRVEKSVVDHRAESDPLRTFTRRYVYDGDEILLEYDGDNALLARYTHSGLRTDDVLAVDVTSAGVDRKIAQSSGSHFFLKDALGSVTEVVNASSAVLQRIQYSSFGKVLAIRDAMGADITSAPKLALYHSYTGREFDSESGLYYYRARYYDAGSGRFLQKDPHPGELTDPITTSNSYIYAANSPQNYVDPSGEFFETLFEGVIIAGALFGNKTQKAWATDFLFAQAAAGAILLSGGTAAGAGAAVGSAALGSMMAAMAMSAGQGKHGPAFWDSTYNNFHTIFRISALFLAGSAIAGGISAKTGVFGKSSADSFISGGNWIQGYAGPNVKSATSGAGFAGGGTSAWVSGPGAPITHELLHGVQYIGYSFIAGRAQKNGYGSRWILLPILYGGANDTWVALASVL